jgi:hypothetical protein
MLNVIGQIAVRRVPWAIAVALLGSCLFPAAGQTSSKERVKAFRASGD